MNLKRNLKRILSDKDITVAHLSRQTDVPKTTIAEWLSGSSPRDLSKVKAVADYLHISLDSLCFGDGVQAEAIEKYLEEINAGSFEVILRRLKTKRGDS